MIKTLNVSENRNWTLLHEPRKWQIEALAEWSKKFKGIASVVTGGGKTLFAFCCILEFIKKFEKGRVVIVVPTITLLDQWYISLLEDFSVRSDQIACFSSEENPKEGSDINIMVINTARKLLGKIENRDDLFLIVDECHRAGSPANSKAIAGNYAATLGLSATPEREYDTGFKKYIEKNLGNIIYKYEYLAALKDGVISPFELVNVKVKFLPHESIEYNKISKRIKILLTKEENIKLTDPRLKRLLIIRAKVTSSAIMRIPVSCKLVEEEPNQKIIIFHETIDGANQLKDILAKRNHSVLLYHTGIGPSIRRDNLRLFRKGIFRILVTCKALDEGMNAPETSVAIIASSTASTRQRIQRLGRVLRPSPNKKQAIIYTLYTTLQEKNRLLKESDKLSEDIKITWLKGERK